MHCEYFGQSALLQRTAGMLTLGFKVKVRIRFRVADEVRRFVLMVKDGGPGMHFVIKGLLESIENKCVCVSACENV